MSDEHVIQPDLSDFEQITTDIHSWTDAAEGDFIIGTLKEIMPFTGGQFESEAQQYILDCDGELVSTVLGTATDKQIKGVVKKGDRVYIEFRGKVHLDDGRSVNKFRVLKAKHAKNNSTVGS